MKAGHQYRGSFEGHAERLGNPRLLSDYRRTICHHVATEKSRSRLHGTQVPTRRILKRVPPVRKANHQHERLAQVGRDNSSIAFRARIQHGTGRSYVATQIKRATRKISSNTLDRKPGIQPRRFTTRLAPDVKFKRIRQKHRDLLIFTYPLQQISGIAHFTTIAEYRHAAHKCADLGDPGGAVPRILSWAQPLLHCYSIPIFR